MSDFPGIPTPAAPGTPYGRAPGTPGPSVRASPSAPAPSAPGDIRSIRREASAHAFRLQAAATMLIGACSALMCMQARTTHGGGPAQFTPEIAPTAAALITMVPALIGTIPLFVDRLANRETRLIWSVAGAVAAVVLIVVYPFVVDDATDLYLFLPPLVMTLAAQAVGQSLAGHLATHDAETGAARTALRTIAGLLIAGPAAIYLIQLWEDLRAGVDGLESALVSATMTAVLIGLAVAFIRGWRVGQVPLGYILTLALGLALLVSALLDTNGLLIVAVWFLGGLYTVLGAAACALRRR